VEKFTDIPRWSGVPSTQSRDWAGRTYPIISDIKGELAAQQLAPCSPKFHQERMTQLLEELVVLAPSNPIARATLNLIGREPWSN
jgi:hypothetical protein